jgi:hypothetical protein
LAPAGRTDVVQSVPTGNMEPSAVSKLTISELDHLTDVPAATSAMLGTVHAQRRISPGDVALGLRHGLACNDQ